VLGRLDRRTGRPARSRFPGLGLPEAVSGLRRAEGVGGAVEGVRRPWVYRGDATRAICTVIGVVVSTELRGLRVMFGRSFVTQVAMSVFESLEPTGQVVNMGWEDIGLYCSR